MLPLKIISRIFNNPVSIRECSVIHIISSKNSTHSRTKLLHCNTVDILNPKNKAFCMPVVFCSSSKDKKSDPQNAAPDSTSKPSTSFIKEAFIKVIPRKKVKDHSSLSLKRNFLTPIRAMHEFLLKPADLDGLRKTQRRSPFENEPPITVFWRKDVEEKAIEVWGSAEALEKARRSRGQSLKDYQNQLLRLNQLLKTHENKKEPKAPPSNPSKTNLDSSGKVVWAAVVVNGINFVMKLGAWVYTGSHSLFAEALHSLADVTNQLILAYGIHKSQQSATTDHPYGYTNMRYVASLISGAMIFCIGSGLSFQHGISGLMHPTDVLSYYWAFYILGGSLLTEGGTLLMAMHATRQGARNSGMSISQYVLRGADPSVNVVLLEDMAAVAGVGVALTCMGLASYTNSHIPDAIGSCLIGGLLAGISTFIIYTNSAALVGRSIPQNTLEVVNNELESDVMIRAIYDVKGIDMGSGYVRYKAEVDFDGRELTRSYLETQDLVALTEIVKKIETPEQLEEFLLTHGENIIDCLGAEVDRIEKILKRQHPEIRHCDLEIL